MRRRSALIYMDKIYLAVIAIALAVLIGSLAFTAITISAQ
jgi:hypothetical protein